MENRTEFNLENNLSQWKSILSTKNNLTISNIIELENHLIDLIDDLESKGLSEEESFIIAKKRIGKIDDICLEFDKVNNDFSFTNKAIPFLKGALIYITFIILSKLFFVATILLSEKSHVDKSSFNIITIILLVFVSMIFFFTLHFNLKRGKSFLNKFSNVNVLVALIVVSSLITFRLWGQVPLPGINPSEIGQNLVGLNFYSMENNFIIYKMLSGIILLTTSLIFFWRNRKHNKLKYAK